MSYWSAVVCASALGAAVEVDVLRQLHRPGGARLDRRVVEADVAAPGAVALLQAQRLDGAVAGVHQAVLAARRHHGPVDVDGVLGRPVELPAELADVGDAQRQHRAAGAADALMRSAAEGGVGQTGSAALRDRGFPTWVN